MAAVMTILEATVPGELWPELQDGWAKMSEDKPSEVERSWLVQGAEGRDTWCIVSVWRSREAFDAYVASVDMPLGVRLFRSLDAEPVRAVFDVVGEA